MGISEEGGDLMALSIEPESKDFGSFGSPPNITAKIKEDNNLEIRGTARFIDGENNTVKTDTFTDKGKYDYTANFNDKWDSMAEGDCKVELSVTSYEEIAEQPVYADKNSLYLEQDTFFYDGTIKTPVLHGYDPNKMLLFGNQGAAPVGNYNLRVRILDGYYWAMPQNNGGKYSDLVFPWKIKKNVGYIDFMGNRLYNSGYTIRINKLNQKMSYPYTTGNGKMGTIVSYPNSSIAQVSLEEGVGYGNYYLVVTAYSNGTTSFSLKIPEDESLDSVTINFTIVVDAIKTIDSIPSQSGTLYENGSYQSPSWSNYDSNKLDLSGDTYGIYAGTYYAYFIPRTGYQWYDGTTSSKTVTWSIEQYTPPTPVYSNPTRLSDTSVSVCWYPEQDAYVWIYNLSSSYLKVNLRTRSGYGPFATFDLNAKPGTGIYVSEWGEISPFSSERIKICTDAPVSMTGSVSGIDITYRELYSNEIIGTDEITVYCS